MCQTRERKTRACVEPSAGESWVLVRGSLHLCLFRMGALAWGPCVSRSMCSWVRLACKRRRGATRFSAEQWKSHGGVCALSISCWLSTGDGEAMPLLSTLCHYGAIGQEELWGHTSGIDWCWPPLLLPFATVTVAARALRERGAPGSRLVKLAPPPFPFPLTRSSPFFQIENKKKRRTSSSLHLSSKVWC